MACVHHATNLPSCGHDSAVTHQTGSLYLEQLTNIKYRNPCQPKLHPPPTENRIFTPENNQLHHNYIDDSYHLPPLKKKVVISV